MTTFLEKSCSFGLPRVPFVNCRQYMYLDALRSILECKIGTAKESFRVKNNNVNIKSEMRFFKSNENIHKKEGGSYYVVSANKASSVTL